MEFADIILFTLYLAVILALLTALWSYFRMRCRSTGRGAVQNGIRVRVMDYCVWTFVLAVAAVAALLGDGSVADTMLLILLTVAAAAVLTVVWSMARRK